MLTNKRFVITTTILSRADGATPADVTWYRGEDHAQTLAALVSAAAPSHDEGNLPESMKFDVKAVRMDIYDIEPECSGAGRSADEYRNGYQTVPYCRSNPGGCPLHYPSEQVSGNSVQTDGAIRSTVHLFDDCPYMTDGDESITDSEEQVDVTCPACNLVLVKVGG